MRKVNARQGSILVSGLLRLLRISFFAAIWLLALWTYLMHGVIFAPLPSQPDGTELSIGKSGETCSFKTQDSTELRGYFFAAPNEPMQNPVVLWCSGNKNEPVAIASIVQGLRLFGTSVFLYEPVKAEQSKTKSYEKTLQAHALAAYEYLITGKKFSPTQIVFFGRASEGATAIYLASRRPAKALIVEDTWASLGSIVAETWPTAKLPPQLPPTPFNSQQRITNIPLPTLIMHSEKNELVSLAQARQLFEHSKAPHKELWVIPGANHLQGYWMGGAAYFAKMREFIRK